MDLNFLLRWISTGVALYAAAYMLPGITVTGGEEWKVLGGLAILLGLINALIKPLLKLLTCPIQVMTLGLFTFVLNGAMLMLASASYDEILGPILGGGFDIEGWVPAILGALIVSIVSAVINGVLGLDSEK